MYGLLAIEWAQTGLITYVAFDVFVYNFGDTESLTKIYYGWLLVDVMCAIVSVTVQLFFVWRIYVLARSPFVAGVITLVCHLLCLCVPPMILITALELVAFTTPRICRHYIGLTGEMFEVSDCPSYVLTNACSSRTRKVLLHTSLPPARKLLPSM